MRVVGRDVVQAFIVSGASAFEAETLQAWFSELAHRTWRNADALAAAFRNVVVDDTALTVFFLAAAPLRIKTIIDFRTGVVLVTTIERTRALENDTPATGRYSQ